MKQEENIRALAIQYFEGRISRADERTLFESLEQAEDGYGRFRQWEKEWMNNRVSDSQTNAEWEALKHKIYTQEAIVPLLKKPKLNIWNTAEKNFEAEKSSIYSPFNRSNLYGSGSSRNSGSYFNYRR